MQLRPSSAAQVLAPGWHQRGQPLLSALICTRPAANKACPAWVLLLLQAAEAANREVSGDTDEEEEYEEGIDVDVEAGPALAV